MGLQKYKTFFEEHTARVWQRTLASNLILLSTVALLLALVGYSVGYWTTGTDYTLYRTIDFAVAKIVFTVLLLVDTKKRLTFAGPILVGLYVLTVVGFVSHWGIDNAAIILLAAVTILAAGLYGIWSSLLAASIGAAAMFGWLANDFQKVITSGAVAQSPISLNTLIFYICTVYLAGILTSIWHYLYVKRMSPQRMRLGAPPDPRTLYTSDLAINTEKRQVTRGDKTITLRRKEYEILAYLVQHKGQVVTKHTLFENIWHDGSQPDSLGVHIKYLRDKIDKPFDVRLIQTSHGVGYTIKDLPAPQ